jgi:hypothetical protein
MGERSGGSIGRSRARASALRRPRLPIHVLPLRTVRTILSAPRNMNLLL